MDQVFSEDGLGGCIGRKTSYKGIPPDSGESHCDVYVREGRARHTTNSDMPTRFDGVPHERTTALIYYHTITTNQATISFVRQLCMLSVDSGYVVHGDFSLTSRAVVRLNPLQVLARWHFVPWISFFKTHPLRLGQRRHIQSEKFTVINRCHDVPFPCTAPIV
jgi:hypothetical protein